MHTRQKQLVRQLTIVGQKHQPQCIFVQSAAWEQTDPLQFRRQQRRHNRCAVVTCRADIAVRLIQHNVSILAVNHRLPGIADTIRIGIHLRIRAAHDRAVQRNLPAPCRTRNL